MASLWLNYSSGGLSDKTFVKFWSNFHNLLESRIKSNLHADEPEWEQIEISTKKCEDVENGPAAISVPVCLPEYPTLYKTVPIWETIALFFFTLKFSIQTHTMLTENKIFFSELNLLQISRVCWLLSSFLAWKEFDEYLSVVCSGPFNVCLPLIEQIHK